MKVRKILVCAGFALSFLVLSNQVTRADNGSDTDVQQAVVLPGNEATQDNTPRETRINIPMGYFALYGNQENPTNTAQVEAQQIQETVNGETPAPIGAPVDSSEDASPAESAPASLSSSSALLKSFATVKASASSTAPDELNASDASLPRHDAVDVSSYQSWMTQNDFNILKATGVKTVVVKLTQGTWYTNPAAKNQIRMAQAAGLNVSVYHYVELGETSTQNQGQANAEAAAEANYFASVASSLGLSNSVTMIADCEDSSVPASISWTQAIRTFTATLNARGYGSVKYYTSLSWVQKNLMDAKNFGEKNMWIAQYLYGKPSASNLRNTQYGAWQFSSLMYYNGMSASKPIDTSIDYAGLFNSGNTSSADVYRMYNPNSGEHFYTEDTNERESLIRAGWNYERVGWTAPTQGAPVYRVYNPNAGDHFYTLDSNEKDHLVSLGWRYEGISFYSGGSAQVYRAYNPNAKAGSHNYTLDSNEQNSLLGVGWRGEGTAWYALR